MDDDSFEQHFRNAYQTSAGTAAPSGISIAVHDNARTRLLDLVVAINLEFATREQFLASTSYNTLAAGSTWRHERIASASADDPLTLGPKVPDIDSFAEQLVTTRSTLSHLRDLDSRPSCMSQRCASSSASRSPSGRRCVTTVRDATGRGQGLPVERSVQCGRTAPRSMAEPAARRNNEPALRPSRRVRTATPNFRAELTQLTASGRASRLVRHRRRGRGG